MHMADALIVPSVAGTMYACSAVAAGFSVREVRIENDAKKLPLMGVMGAFVFAAQMINFTIPGTGSSGHLCGGMLLSALLGPYAGFLTMIGVLVIQCLLFADGGLLALGCNIWNMAFYGCFVGSMLIWNPIMQWKFSKKRIIIASILGCTITLQLGAFSVALETMLSGVTSLPFTAFVATMQPIHLAIGVIEGMITSAVLVFLYEARPELLYHEKQITCKEGKMSFRNVLIILAIVTAFIGGMLSLVASSYPDGLEWSIERLTGSTEISSTGAVYETFDAIQKITAILPDYAFEGTESGWGTTFSGIIGALFVAVFCIGCCKIFKFFGKTDKDSISIK